MCDVHCVTFCRCESDLHVLAAELPYERDAYLQLEAALAHWVHSLGCTPWLQVQVAVVLLQFEHLTSVCSSRLKLSLRC